MSLNIVYYLNLPLTPLNRNLNLVEPQPVLVDKGGIVCPMVPVEPATARASGMTGAVTQLPPVLTSLSQTCDSLRTFYHPRCPQSALMIPLTY